MNDDIAIKVEHVSKTFKLPHDKQSSIKGGLISLVKGGKRSYEKQDALEDVSFDIKKGEFFGIVGRNGSGKSTMLKMLAGIYTPSSGGIQVNGKLTPFIELGVGFNPELTGRENVFLNGALLGFNRKEMASMYQDIVEFAEIERFMDQKLKNYSSGMQVRLAFSIAIRAQGDILLLDEVLAVGDAAFQQKCYNYFEELRRQKKTVVFVSHDMGAVRRFCTQAVYLENGKMRMSGSAIDIANHYIEENIEKVKKDDKATKVKSKKKLSTEQYKLNANITPVDSGNELVLEYTSQTKEELYVGISVLWQGISVAEFTTSPDEPLVGSGKVSLTIDTSLFNPGTYVVTAALFNWKNRALLAVPKQDNTFSVGGVDITRGGALALSDTWVYGK